MRATIDPLILRQLCNESQKRHLFRQSSAADNSARIGLLTLLGTFHHMITMELLICPRPP